MIADWFRPNSTGIELCTKIREANLLVEPFILMMTSNNDRHVEAKALNAGAGDFISKPANKIDIEAKLTLGWRLIRTQLELLVVNQRLSERYSLWLPKKYQLRGRPHKDPEKRRFSGT